MSDPVSWFVIERGWEVVDRDGEKIGEVDEVVGDSAEDIFNGLVVSSGWLGRPRYVPAERVAAITSGRVELAVSRAGAEQLAEHEEPPASLEISSEKAGVADRVADALTDGEGRGEPLTPWQRFVRRVFRRS